MGDGVASGVYIELESDHIESAIIETVKTLSITLKGKQFEAIYNFCSQKDVFVSLPTGFGKSVIYGLLPFQYI